MCIYKVKITCNNVMSTLKTRFIWIELLYKSMLWTVCQPLCFFFCELFLLEANEFCNVMWGWINFIWDYRSTIRNYIRTFNNPLHQTYYTIFCISHSHIFNDTNHYKKCLLFQTSIIILLTQNQKNQQQLTSMYQYCQK